MKVSRFNSTSPKPSLHTVIGKLEPNLITWRGRSCSRKHRSPLGISLRLYCFSIASELKCTMFQTSPSPCCKVLKTILHYQWILGAARYLPFRVLASTQPYANEWADSQTASRKEITSKEWTCHYILTRNNNSLMMF